MLRAERLAAILLALLVLLLPAGAAKAAEESGDAGPLPGSAQDLGQSADLSGIDGALESAGDVDVYRVCLSAGSAFSADTVGGSEVDTQLFLLDEAGLGVYSNDDATAAARQSLLPAGDPLTPANGGVYHLAISGFDLQPFSAGGAIFPNSTLAVAGPTGEGGAQPVERWSGRAGTPGGAYRIALSGVERCPRPDASPPTIDLRSPADGAVVARGNQVMVDYSCADEPGGSGLARCEGTVAMGGHLDTTTLGPGTFTVSASDAAGNTASVSHSYTVVDREDPTVTIRSPLDGAIYLIGQEVYADYDCVDEAGGSGPMLCEGEVPDGGRVDTTSVGTHDFRVRAWDRAGNEASASSMYRVRYDFKGFLRPVRNPPAVNVVRAARRVPVRFSLGGYFGLRVLAAGGPWSLRVDCQSGEKLGEVVPAVSTPRRRGLRFRRRGERYQYSWRTERSWAGSCRQLVLELADGTRHRANFRFTGRLRAAD